MGIESQNLSMIGYLPPGVVPQRNESHKTDLVKVILTKADANKDGVVSSLEYDSYRNERQKSQWDFTGDVVLRSAEYFIEKQFEDLAKTTGGHTQSSLPHWSSQYYPSTIKIDKIDTVAAKDGSIAELSSNDISIAKDELSSPRKKPGSTSMDQLSRQNNLIMQLLMMLLQRFMPQFGGMMRF